ncbi:MAG: trypsin-like peptidase domain-containing protein, partial [Acidobacteriota bacterium]
MRSLTFVLASALLLAAPMVTPSVSSAQSASLPSTVKPLGVDSGEVAASSKLRGPTAVYTTEVGGHREPWVRLQFERVLLAGQPAAGNGSYLRITSLADGAQQTLDSNELADWNDTSAYFNGARVRVELMAYPGTGPNRVGIVSATLGSYETEPRSICGETDDRVPSSDPRVARLLAGGICTAFLTDEGDCANRFLTAGHCVDGNDSAVVQFNVPPSLPNGTNVHPPPEHQYPVDAGSVENVDEGVGEEYGTFVVGVNSETGLTPRAAQGAAFHLLNSVSSQTDIYWKGVRVTSYGNDEGVDDNTLQTDRGPLVEKNGTRIRYFLDTTVGSSGGPVIDRRDERIVGIHTHGGCSTDPESANNGTAIDHPGLTALLASGPAGTCEEHNFCVPDAFWYPDGADSWDDAEPIDAWYDQANCYVHALGPTDGEPFIQDNHAYYVTPGPNGVCEQGWFDGANCRLGYAPRWRTPF